MNGQVHGVKLNIETGSKLVMECPIYQVSPDGKVS